jgi:hypothetical protein
MMRLTHQMYLVVSFCVFGLCCAAQQPKTGTNQNPIPSVAQTSSGSAETAPKAQVDALQKEVDTIQADLKKQDSDFALTLGIGSLVLNSGVTDYINASNVLQATNLGRATPQYLAGVSMRTAIPNFSKFNCNNTDGSKKSPDEGSTCDLWKQRPWEAFVSIKFSPQASQTINGYVIGGSYAIAKHLAIMIGYALSPVNEPAPGFRVAASQYVTQQQALGLDLNFNPVAMSKNEPDAFDGFPVVDSTGKLFYKGNATEVHYRGGAVFGVTIPLTFSPALSSKSH